MLPTSFSSFDIKETWNEIIRDSKFNKTDTVSVKVSNSDRTG